MWSRLAMLTVAGDGVADTGGSDVGATFMENLGQAAGVELGLLLLGAIVVFGGGYFLLNALSRA